jgi:hypothetical protein
MVSELQEDRPEPDEVIILPLDSAARAAALVGMLARIEKHNLQTPIQLRILDRYGDQIGADIEVTDIRDAIKELEHADVSRPMHSTTVVTFWMLRKTRTAQSYL